MANTAEAEAIWIGSFGTIYKVPSEATGGAVAVVEHVSAPDNWARPCTGTARKTRSPMCSRESWRCSRATGLKPRG